VCSLPSGTAFTQDQQQERLLKSHLSALCRLYNELRDLRINTWREKHASLSDDELRQAALDMRKNDERLKEIHSQVVQNVATRVYTAFKNYLEGRARFPKHKKRKRGGTGPLLTLSLGSGHSAKSLRGEEQNGAY
jgi:transposase